MGERLFEVVGLLHLADSVVNFSRVDVRTGLETFQIPTLRDSGFTG